MTVQELIDKLSQVENKNLKIVVKGTDPTDWTYNNDLEGISEENVFYGDIDDFYYRRRLVLDGGMF